MNSLHPLQMMYPHDQVFLTSVLDFQPESQMMTGDFLVPSSQGYTLTPILYVTGEQALRCLNQLAYVLMWRLVESGSTGFECIGCDTFVGAMTSYRMWLADYHIRHKEMVVKDTTFSITLKVVRARASTQGQSIVRMGFDGPISGELTFATKFDPAPP